MAKNTHNAISNETVEEAQQIANKTQKPGQTKEQTRLIVQGIQKGIAEYKKSVKAKQRQADKEQKKQQKQKQQNTQPDEIEETIVATKSNPLPWILLVTSWVCFGAYLFILNK
jgi:hypothetical protein